MRRFAFLAPLTAALALAGAAAAAAPHAAQAGNRDFTLANGLPVSTISVFVRPAGANGWSQDLLGSNVLASGQQAHFRLGNGPECVFDVKLRLPNAGEHVFSGVNLCSLSSMSVTWRDGAVRASLRSF